MVTNLGGLFNDQELQVSRPKPREHRGLNNGVNVNVYAQVRVRLQGRGLRRAEVFCGSATIHVRPYVCTLLHSPTRGRDHFPCKSTEVNFVPQLSAPSLGLGAPSCSSRIEHLGGTYPPLMGIEPGVESFLNHFSGGDRSFLMPLTPLGECCNHQNAAVRMPASSTPYPAVALPYPACTLP